MGQASKPERQLNCPNWMNEWAVKILTEQKTDKNVVPNCASARHGWQRPHESSGLKGPFLDKTTQTTGTAS